MSLRNGLGVLQDKLAESMEERGKGNLNRTRRTYLDTVKHCYDFIKNGRGSNNCPETMPWDAIALREGEKTNIIFSPRPRLSGMDLCRRNRHFRGRREEHMRRSRDNEVSVRLVNNESNAISLGEVGEGSSEIRGICSARLIIQISTCPKMHVKPNIRTHRVVRSHKSDGSSLRSDESCSEFGRW